MNMFDEARAMAWTMKLCRITQKELAEQMGVSQSYVANKLRLLTIPEPLQRLILQKNISERHARAILRLESKEDMREILEKVTQRTLTVRECEALVDLKVDSYAPTVIERAESLSRIDVFLDTLKKSLDTLRSLGIDVNETTSYHGQRMYVTVCFENV